MPYKRPCHHLYHVFSHGIDDWVTTLKEARKIARALYKEYGTVRIYKETDWDNDTGIFTEEDCIFGKGEFPS